MSSGDLVLVWLFQHPDDTVTVLLPVLVTPCGPGCFSEN
jgi:hypothetical protein